MSRTEAVLRLYRAAREFTRRVTGVETLEEAALAYARELGWLPAKEMHERSISQAADHCARKANWFLAEAATHTAQAKVACAERAHGASECERELRALWETGWLSGAHTLPLTINVQADPDAVIAKQRRRIGDLRNALRDLMRDLPEREGASDWHAALERARMVLG